LLVVEFIKSNTCSTIIFKVSLGYECAVCNTYAVAEILPYEGVVERSCDCLVVLLLYSKNQLIVVVCYGREMLSLQWKKTASGNIDRQWNIRLIRLPALTLPPIDSRM